MNKSNVLKKLIVVACIGMATLVVSCGGGLDFGTNPVKTVTVKMKGDFDVVKVGLWGSVSGNVFASANCVDGSFVIELPAQVDGRLLLDPQMEFYGLDVSDKKARIRNVQIMGFKTGSPEGSPIRVTSSHIGLAHAGAELYYVDRDVTITGSATAYGRTVVYEQCDLKKGWNFIYHYSDNNPDDMVTTYTVSNPGRLKWGL